MPYAALRRVTFPNAEPPARTLARPLMSRPVGWRPRSDFDRSSRPWWLREEAIHPNRVAGLGPRQILLPKDRRDQLGPATDPCLVKHCLQVVLNCVHRDVQLLGNAGCR